MELRERMLVAVPQPVRCWCRCQQLNLTNTGQVLDGAGDGGEDMEGLVVGTVVGGTTACRDTYVW